VLLLSKKKPRQLPGFFVHFGSLSLSVFPQKTPGQFTGTTASAGAVFGHFDGHVFIPV
jgi:hypothetical protein